MSSRTIGVACPVCREARLQRNRSNPAAVLRCPECTTEFTVEDGEAVPLKKPEPEQDAQFSALPVSALAVC